MKAKVKLNDYNNTVIKISGSKNSSLPIIAASLLCDEICVINNIPNISDVNKLINIIRKMGYNIFFKNGTIITKPTLIKRRKFYFRDIKKIRGSYYLIGAMIGKYRYCDFSFLYPGGCNFDNRPIDFHLQSFNRMGIETYSQKKKLHFKGTKKESIHDLSYPSVGTTINIILASCKLNGRTIINNASIEPEVIDLCEFIKTMGANITTNDRTIIIEGKEYFTSSHYTVMSDRIEAATFLKLGAIQNGITITNIREKDIAQIIELFKEIGFGFDICKQYISLYKSKNTIKPFNISLNPYPGIPTDIGPVLCVLASQINGVSTIVDNVYPNRISHINELRKLNIDITFNDNVIFINGKKNITNNKVKVKDLRCGAALLLAASLCYNYTYINDVDIIFRGYDNIKQKLDNLGIDFII